MRISAGCWHPDAWLSSPLGIKQSWPCFLQHAYKDWCHTCEVARTGANRELANLLHAPKKKKLTRCLTLIFDLIGRGEPRPEAGEPAAGPRRA